MHHCSVAAYPCSRCTFVDECECECGGGRGGGGGGGRRRGDSEWCDDSWSMLSLIISLMLSEYKQHVQEAWLSSVQSISTSRDRRVAMNKTLAAIVICNIIVVNIVSMTLCIIRACNRVCYCKTTIV